MHASDRSVLGSRGAPCRRVGEWAINDANNDNYDNYLYDLCTNACGIKYDIIYYNNFHVSLPWCCSVHSSHPLYIF